MIHVSLKNSHILDLMTNNNHIKKKHKKKNKKITTHILKRIV